VTRDSDYCKHGKQKSFCLKCGGSQICKHNRRLAYCIKCHGSQICKHRTQRRQCKECSGVEGWAKHLIVAAKQRATRDKVPFNLTFEKDGAYLMKSLQKGCPVYGFSFSRKGSRNDSSASLDKFLPILGYVTGNICIISWKANKIKSDAKCSEDVKAVADWMKSVELTKV